MYPLKFYFTVVAVFKKNYTRLCNCLPRDHMKTVDKIKQQFNCDDDFLDSIRNKANEMMICFLISRMKSDYDAMNFCNYMEILVDDEASKRVVGDVNDGTYICIVCMTGSSIKGLITYPNFKVRLFIAPHGFNYRLKITFSNSGGPGVYFNQISSCHPIYYLIQNSQAVKKECGPQKGYGE